MRAAQTTLRPLISGEKQFRVPLFQRAYTWTGQELKDLWTDLLEQHALLGQPDSESRLHFLGGFVVAPQPMLAHGVSPFLVIDGQQRLTTLLLALAAMRDVLKETDTRAAEHLEATYLLNPYLTGTDRYKLLPTQDDRDVFFRCIDGHGPGSSDNRLAVAYRFFRGRVGQPIDEGADEVVDPAAIIRVILDRLSIIDIATESGDSPNRIFESLNATGVRLTQTDLLRNYVFMLLPSRQEDVYMQVWKPMERALGEENLESFARYDLLRRGLDVQTGDVYREHERLLAPKAGDEEAVEAAVKDFARLAYYFRRLVEPATESDDGLQRHLFLLRRWGAQTTYPVLLMAYDLLDRGVIGLDHVRGIALNVESFIVRRYIAGVPTNFLNKLFVDLTKQLPADESIVDALRKQLSAGRRYWPTDEQIRIAVRNRPIYTTGRAQQRRVLFERLEESYGHKEPVKLSADLSIEHVMPQTLTDEWRTMLLAQGEDPERLHDELLHTLGNLTLTGFNSELSNNPYERKHQLFEASHLELNREILEFKDWGREQILKRADSLADRIIKIWPAPEPGSKGAVIGFDWTRIDAAVAAIPAGRWTTYGDLAVIGNTSAQAVGNRMLNNPALANAYRVLDFQGRVAEGFKWNDPERDLPAHDVLLAEGIVFDAEGRADPAQRLNALGLAQLIAAEFDPDDLDRLERSLASSTEPTEAMWLTDGRAWHLEYQCSPLTRDVLIAFENLVQESVPKAGMASWNQKVYVAWRRNGKVWMTVHPRQSYLWVELINPPFSPQGFADELGFALVLEGESPSTKMAGPCQVQAGNGRIWFQLKTMADVDGHRGEILAKLVGAAYEGDLPVTPAVQETA